MVFEIVADEIEFLRNIDWEAGECVRKDLVQRGLLRPSHKDRDLDGGGLADTVSAETAFLGDLTIAIPEDVFPDV